MKNCKTTALNINPNFVDKLFLLSNKNRDELFIQGEEIVELIIDSNGILKCNFKNRNKNRNKKITLMKIGTELLNLKNPTVKTVLKYLIIPEMEIERIFNTIRYKYLQCIFYSKIIIPSNKINADYNKAFQSLADIKIYQGNTKDRKCNDYFWRNANFNENTKNNISFKKEFDELDLIMGTTAHLGVIPHGK